jgi:hypothetical protein
MLSIDFPQNKSYLYYCIGNEHASNYSSTRKAGGESMGKYKFIIIALGLIAGFLFAGCDTASVKKNEIDKKKIIAVQQELKEARIAYLAVWRNFKIETEQEIELNQKKIAVLKEIMVDAGPIAIKKYRIRMYALQRTNRELQMALEHFTYNGHSDEKEASTVIAME